MRYAVTAEQMKAADAGTIRGLGIPSLVLMERAALQCVAAMKEAGVDLKRALIVCGSGNNGGDGFAIARLLAEEGFMPDVVLAGNSASRSEETKAQMQILEKMGIPVGNSLPDGEYSVIIDAVFGIGLSRKIEGRYAEVIRRMNAYRGYKVAVDTPSGVCSDTGRILGCAFRADLTVTFAYPKAGQIFYPGCEYAGKLDIRPIGIKDKNLPEREDVYYLLEPSDLAARMPRRMADSHKGTYGKLLVIAGSRGMSGAACLSARAAYTAGAGLVRIYTEESNRTTLQTLLPEAVMTTYDGDDAEPLRELPALLDWADAVCLGCGLGTGEVSRRIVETVVRENKKPCVVDADGLNLLAKLGEAAWTQMCERADYVFTPHMLEMARLTGHTVAELAENRTALLREAVSRWKVVCALKDSRTLVASADAPVFLNTAGNAAMAKAGAGDVLAGTIAGLLAQGLGAREAADTGVYLHGCGGDAARERLGAYSVLAGDIIDGIGRTLTTLEEQQR